MKKLILSLCLLAGLLVPLNAANVALAWNANPETNIVSYTVYQSDGTTVKSNVVLHPTVTTTFTNVLAGVDYTFWATAKNDQFLESDPSASVSFFLPASVPPSVVLNKPTLDFQGGSWRNVQFTWTASPATARTTNYVVTIRNVVTSSTQNFNTTSPEFTFSSIPLDDWVITVAAQNSVGSSPITASSTYTLNKRKPNAPTNLRIQ
jgi:hypothetical protein